jgi:2-polyprenyl-3-methyl-5-hydroxy-6-metoxy-1,4-benzoquinol methylase
LTQFRSNKIIFLTNNIYYQNYSRAEKIQTGMWMAPVGFVFNMQPNSIAKLFDGIGYKIIHKARALEVGCGQGYLMSHLLNAGASHVIGIDLEQSI